MPDALEGFFRPKQGCARAGVLRKREFIVSLRAAHRGISKTAVSEQAMSRIARQKRPHPP